LKNHPIGATATFPPLFLIDFSIPLHITTDAFLWLINLFFGQWLSPFVTLFFLRSEASRRRISLRSHDGVPSFPLFFCLFVMTHFAVFAYTFPMAVHFLPAAHHLNIPQLPAMNLELHQFACPMTQSSVYNGQSCPSFDSFWSVDFTLSWVSIAQLNLHSLSENGIKLSHFCITQSDIIISTSSAFRVKFT